MAQGVTVDFNANIARFTSAIDKATNDLNKFQSNSARISQNINKAFGALGIGLSAAGIGAFIKSSIDAADNINDLSQKIGVSVENLAGYKLAAEQSGTSLEGMGLAAQKLNQSLAKNDPLLKKLGVTATDANGALVQLADVFGSIPDGAQKTAIAMRLMGKSGADMIPLLNGGSAALDEMLRKGKELYPVTAEMAKAADQFNDSMAELKISVEGAGIAIAGPFAKAINDSIDVARRATSEYGTMIGAMAGFGKLLVAPFETTDQEKAIALQEKIINLRALQSKLDKTGGTYDQGNSQFDKARRAQEIKSLQAELDSVFKQGRINLPSKAELKAAAEKTLRDNDIAKKIGDLDLGGTGKSAAPKLDLIDPFGAARRAAEDAAFRAQIDAQNEAFDALAEVRDYAIAQDERHAANLGSLRDAHLAILDPIQQYRDKLDEVQTLLDSGMLTPEQAVAANLYWQDQIEGAAGFGEEMKKVASESEMFFETMAKNVQSSLADFLFDPFSDGLDGLAKGFGDMLKRMAAEAIAADIASAIFGKQSGAGKSGGGMLAGLLGGGSDQNLLGSFASLFGFANGGSFRVGGSGGTDSQLVAFKASPDERVTIQTPAQQRNNGGSQIINMTVVTQDAASFQKSRGQIQADLAMAVAGARRFS